MACSRDITQRSVGGALQRTHNLLISSTTGMFTEPENGPDAVNYLAPAVAARLKLLTAKIDSSNASYDRKVSMLLSLLQRQDPMQILQALELTLDSKMHEALASYTESVARGARQQNEELLVVFGRMHTELQKSADARHDAMQAVLAEAVGSIRELRKEVALLSQQGSVGAAAGPWSPQSESPVPAVPIPVRVPVPVPVPAVPEVSATSVEPVISEMPEVPVVPLAPEPLPALIEELDSALVASVDLDVEPQNIQSLRLIPKSYVCPLSRETSTVAGLVQEWYWGTAGRPSVEETDRRLSRAWRGPVASFYKRRKALIMFMEKQVAGTLFGMQELAQRLDAIRARRRLRLNGLCALCQSVSGRKELAAVLRQEG